VHHVLQLLIDAISLGGFYALGALAVGLIFGIVRLINFAYGDYVTWAAYALVIPSSAQVATPFIANWPAPYLIVAVVLVGVALALATERVVFRPMRSASPETLLIGSFAVSYLLQNTILFVHSGRPKSVNIWTDLTGSIPLLGLRLPMLDLVTILVCLALLLGLLVFLKKTRYGIQMRAAAEDFRMAQFLGVRANTVIAIAFALTGLFAAVVALLLVAKTGVLDYRMGEPVVLVAFVATVVGGMGSVFGAVLGGFIIGFISTMLQSILPIELREARDAFVFGLVVLILIVRPQGLMQVRAMKERV
jgi:branched-chain amino acid transport system permease protein